MPGQKVLEIDRKKIDSKFFCTVCLLLLNSPMQTSCGHLVCYVCLETILNSEESVCPEDGTRLTRAEVFPDGYTRRELLTLQFHCPNEGCDWYGTYKDFQEDHEANCGHLPVSCVHAQCQKEVKRAQLPTHLQQECKYRQVTCQFCKQQLSYGDLKVHLKDTCNSKPVTCQHCNKGDIPRDQLKQHVTMECDEAPAECDFKPIGCKYSKVGKRKELSQHMSRDLNAHVQLIIHFLLSVWQQVQELMTKVNTMATQWLTTEQDVQELKDNVASLEEQTETSRHMLQSIQSTLRSMGATADGGGSRNEAMVQGSERMKRQFQDLSTKHGEIMEQSRRTEARVAEKEEVIERLRRKLEAMDESLTRAMVQLSDMSDLVTASSAADPPPSFNGTLLWKIDEFARKRQEAVNGNMAAIYSPHFYSTQFGYKMCVRIYMNGDGFGKGTHISLFFVVMRSDYDALLPWPFQKKITMMILDQVNGDHMIDAFRSDPDSSSFQRPQNKMNIASGSPLFLPLDRLNNRGYVKDDVMFVKVIVD